MSLEDALKPSLLVVDDEPSIRFVLDQYFTRKGWSVACASSCEEAMALLEQPSFDVAVLDLRLGKGDQESVGIELVRYIARAHPSTLSILLTGYGSQLTREAALAQGAAAVVDKPVRLSSLQGLAIDLLAGREQRGVQGRGAQQ